MTPSIDHLKKLSTLIRHHILTMTHAAGSGHPTTCFSSVDLMTVLFFKYFQADLPAGRQVLDDFNNPLNDRLIFSKGHASALLYSLYATAGKISKEELLGYRTIDSNLEGHPTFRFPYTEAATGSLGQGLSIGAGEAWAIKFAVGSSQLADRSLQKEESSLRGEIRQLEENDEAISHKILKLVQDDGKIASPSARNDVPRVYVLLGDGELAEGSVWEAASFASHYKLNNLVAIVDVNRFGQSEETMHGHDVAAYEKKFRAFGWETVVIDGHDLEEIDKAFEFAVRRSQLAAGNDSSLNEVEGSTHKPFIILAKTVKGKGISVWENKNGWHNKMLSPEEFEKGKKELGEVDWKLRGEVKLVRSSQLAVGSEYNKVGSTQSAVRSNASSLRVEDEAISRLGHSEHSEESKIAAVTSFPRNDVPTEISITSYSKEKPVATKKAFGNAIERLGKEFLELVVIDGDVKNSLHTDQFEKSFPDRFIQGYIAEQNMVGVATGLARLGMKPVVSTFSAFFTRAHDQIRMLPLSGAKVLFNGSYGGVSIGKDGPSQMGLEDLALFRNIHGSTVLYPSDAVSTEKLMQKMIVQQGVVYIRTTREPTPVLYGGRDEFKIGGSKVFSSQLAAGSGISSLRAKRSNLSSGEIVAGRSIDPRNDVTIIAAGITVFEALKAQKKLEKEGISTQVIDCYSIKPIDVATLKKAAVESRLIITVEDHFPVGGLGDAVLEALADTPHPPVIKLAVNKLPKSGKPEELLGYVGISAEGIFKLIQSKS